MTTTRSDSPGRMFSKLALLLIVTTIFLAAVGYLPTQALAEQGGLRGMYLGLGAALVAGLAGLVPPVLAAGRAPRDRLSGTLAGMGLRFVVMLALLLASLLSGWGDRLALALWAVVGYIVLLVADTVGVCWLNRDDSRSAS